MNEADVDFVITHPEGYELDPKFVRGAHVEYDQMKHSKELTYLCQELGMSGSN